MIGLGTITMHIKNLEDITASDRLKALAVAARLRGSVASGSSEQFLYLEHCETAEQIESIRAAGFIHPLLNRATSFLEAIYKEEHANLAHPLEALYCSSTMLNMLRSYLQVAQRTKQENNFNYWAQFKAVLEEGLENDAAKLMKSYPKAALTLLTSC